MRCIFVPVKLLQIIAIMQSNQLDYLPILMQAGLAIGFVVLMIIGSSFLGPKRHSKNKDKNFVKIV